MTEELHVWRSYQAHKCIPCQLFAPTVRTQSIYAVSFQRNISKSCPLLFLQYNNPSSQSVRRLGYLRAFTQHKGVISTRRGDGRTQGAITHSSPVIFPLTADKSFSCPFRGGPELRLRRRVMGTAVIPASLKPISLPSATDRVRGSAGRRASFHRLRFYKALRVL